MDKDLPEGYRWANEEECERWSFGTLDMEAIVVPRTVDASGKPYTQDEADLAVPLCAPRESMLPVSGWQ